MVPFVIVITIHFHYYFPLVSREDHHQPLCLCLHKSHGVCSTPLEHPHCHISDRLKEPYFWRWKCSCLKPEELLEKISNTETAVCSEGLTRDGYLVAQGGQDILSKQEMTGGPWGGFAWMRGKVWRAVGKQGSAKWKGKFGTAGQAWRGQGKVKPHSIMGMPHICT